MSTQNAFDAAQKYCPYLSGEKEPVHCLNTDCMAWRDDDCVLITSKQPINTKYPTKPAPPRPAETAFIIKGS